MSKLLCIEFNKIKNPKHLAETIYINFEYLSKYPNLLHNKEEIIKLLSSNTTLGYLLYDNKKLIAYLVGEYKSLNDNRHIFYISYIYVAQKYRSKKIGQQLMHKIINKCKSQNIHYIILTCDSHDDKVVNFYKKLNFQPDKTLNANNDKHIVLTLFV